MVSQSYQFHICASRSVEQEIDNNFHATTEARHAFRVLTAFPDRNTLNASAVAVFCMILLLNTRFSSAFCFRSILLLVRQIYINTRKGSAQARVSTDIFHDCLRREICSDTPITLAQYLIIFFAVHSVHFANFLRGIYAEE